MMDQLNALIDQAEKEGKWLFCSYQELWFSPAQLREENRNGRFRWGVVNWRLRDPQEQIDIAKQRAANAAAEVDRVITAVQAAKGVGASTCRCQPEKN